MTRKALELCAELAREAGMTEAEMDAYHPAPGELVNPWTDWYNSEAKIRGSWRTMRCIAAAAALGDVQCLLKLRSMFGLPIFC